MAAMPGADPFELGRTILEDTPWWESPDGGRTRPFDNRRGTERSLGFCDPYGFESEVRVMGGMSDPDREAYYWHCRNYAQGRYRMVCVNGHAGTMRLCYGHVWSIQNSPRRAKNGLCPRCAWPPRARELDEKMNRIMSELWQVDADRRRYLARDLEDCRREMDELRERGTITSGAPLRLEEIS